jgi:hypothetical protein
VINRFAPIIESIAGFASLSQLQGADHLQDDIGGTRNSIAAVTESVVYVGADSQIAVVSELARGLPVPLVTSRRVMNQDNSWIWTEPERTRKVCVDESVIVSLNRNSLR